MQKNFTTTDGAVLSYSDVGAGPPLVFLPGWSQSAAMFQHQIAEFSSTRRVIAIDFRGHGKSPDATGGFRIVRFAADILELAAHEQVGQADFVGWSMGASVLWAMVDLFGTGRFRSLTFIDEPASVMRQAGMTNEDATHAGALFDAATMVAIAEQIKGNEGKAARSAFLDSMVTKGIDPELKAWLLAENLRADPRCIADLFVDHCSINWSDVFRRIDTPTLILGGRTSHVDCRSQQWIHSQIPHSELTIFEDEEGGAHFPFLESPQHFNSVLKAFLERQGN